MKNWLKIYEDNELLITNFVNLQRREEILASEYINLMTAIDGSHLLVTNQNRTKEQFAEIVKKLLKETNFILDLSDDEIEKLAIKVKDTRRYFVHSNKTQRDSVNRNITVIMDITSMLIESLRARIMMEIGIDKKTIEAYYKNITRLERIKDDIVNDINIEDEITDERIKKGKKIMKPLSKKDKENIAELNAITGTHYRETAYDLDNTKDLIEAVENLTAEYIDYTNYWLDLENVLENFDQSLEVFNPEKWFNMVKEGETGSNLIDETIISLREASENMSDLADMAEQKCREIWKILLLGKNKEAIEEFVGDIKDYNEEQLLQAIEDTIENIVEIGHANQVQEDCMNFANEVKSNLEYLKNEKE